MKIESFYTLPSKGRLELFERTKVQVLEAINYWSFDLGSQVQALWTEEGGSDKR